MTAVDVRAMKALRVRVLGLTHKSNVWGLGLGGAVGVVRIGRGGSMGFIPYSHTTLPR